MIKELLTVVLPLLSFVLRIRFYFATLPTILCRGACDLSISPAANSLNKFAATDANSCLFRLTRSGRNQNLFMDIV